MVAVYGTALLWLEIRVSLATVVLTWLLYTWGALDHILKHILEQELSKSVFLPVKIRSFRLFLSYSCEHNPAGCSRTTGLDWLGTTTAATTPIPSTSPLSWWQWFSHHLTYCYEWWWYHSLRGVVVMQDVCILPPLLDTRWEEPAIVTVSQVPSILSPYFIKPY